MTDIETQDLKNDLAVALDLIEKTAKAFDEHQESIISFGQAVNQGNQMMINMWEKKEADLFKELKDLISQGKHFVLDNICG